MISAICLRHRLLVSFTIRNETIAGVSALVFGFQRGTVLRMLLLDTADARHVDTVPRSQCLEPCFWS